jgi:hypothetical protein
VKKKAVMKTEIKRREVKENHMEICLLGGLNNEGRIEIK